MTNRLFVYGTLAPGRANQHILAGISGAWETATVRGTLLQEGWKGDVWYPGFIPADTGDAVAGLVFTSDELPAHWQRIDDFEGDGYIRVLVAATLQSGTTVSAFVYALANAASGIENSR